MKETIEKVINSAKAEYTGDGHPHFDDRRYIAYPLSENNFRPIDFINSDKKIAFVDGSNAEIFSSSNICIGFVRVYCSIFQKNKKIGSKKSEFYAVIKTAVGKETVFSSEIFPLAEGMIIPDAKDLSFSINDVFTKPLTYFYNVIVCG